MSNSNAHIIEFLNHYLEKENFPDYAVLITGCWGSGKTHFVKEYLGGETKVIKDWLTDCEKYTVLYVSLFGAKSREEMDSRVLEKLHPKLHSEVMKDMPNAISLLGKVIGMTSGNPVITVAGEAISIFADDFLETIREKKQRIVVVFDDVERADMPLPELLGYLNEYVEYLHIPCILLADKDKWEDAQKCQGNISTLHHLSSTKEKVIGKEFQIQTSFDTVWNHWFDKNEHFLGDKAWKILKDYHDVVAQIVEASGISNFRSLKHTLLDFQRFIDSIEDSLLINPEFNSLLIADFVAHQYAYYLGWFNASEIGKSNVFERVSLKRYKNMSEEELNKKCPESSYDIFKTKFDKIDRLTSFDLFDSYCKQWSQIWIEWLGSNTVNKENLNRVIKTSLWFDGKVPHYLTKVQEWHRLDDDEGDRTWLAVEKGLKEGAITQPSLIMSLFYRLYWYASKNVLKETPQELVKKMENYVKSHQDDLEDDRIEDWKSLRIERGLLDSMYLEYETTNDAFLEFLCKANEGNRDARKQRAINFFWEKIGSPLGNDYKEPLGQIGNPKFPLVELDVDRLCMAYQSLEASVKYFFYSSLKTRYYSASVSQYNMELVNTERDYLELLKRKAEEIFNSAKRPLKVSVFGLYYLIETIEEILSGKRKDA